MSIYDNTDVDLSIVIPAYNEAGNLGALVDEIVWGLRELAQVPDYEIIIVDDCSSDTTLSEARSCMERYEQVRVYSHEVRAGKSAALRSAFAEVEGPWVVTFDGDGQNDPADLVKYWDYIATGPSNRIYAGVRRRRNDGIVKMLTSRFANRIRRFLLDDGTRDTGCGFKVMPKALVKNLPYFDNMHRFFPALAKLNGFDVEELVINDRPRQHGMSKYGFFDRASVAMLDLIGVFWLKQRKYRAGRSVPVLLERQISRHSEQSLSDKPLGPHGNVGT